MSRVLLIIGSSGIGAATATMAAQRGDRVFLVGKNGAECEELSTIAAASYYAAHGIRLNVLAPSLVRTGMSARAQTDPAILEFTKGKAASETKSHRAR